jgi:dephospho-CoA kinase
MLRIGLTGGIGSGKSTVAAMFAERGVPVIDTDEIAKDLAAPGAPAYKRIVRAFGDVILNSAGEIDRARLRARVFSHNVERHRLESILHPLIRAEVARRVKTLQVEYCIIVIPLLYEAKFENIVDRVLLIDADELQQVSRAAARSHMTEDEIHDIMAAQFDAESRRQRADDVLENRTDFAQLQSEVDRLHEKYRSLANSKDGR